MIQDTAFGEAELVTYMKVMRANGSPNEYFRVEDGRNIFISAEEYMANTGEEA